MACPLRVRVTRSTISPTRASTVGMFSIGVQVFHTSIVSFVFRRDLYGYPSEHGAIFSNRKSYGPVRCGFFKSEILRCGSVRFSGIVNPTVRFGFVIIPTVRFGAVFKNRKSYGAVRCGFRKLEILRCGSVL